MLNIKSKSLRDQNTYVNSIFIFTGSKATAKIQFLTLLPIFTYVCVCFFYLHVHFMRTKNEPSLFIS